MKLKEFLGKVVENKKNGQLNTCFKKGKLKESGISEKDLLDLEIKFIRGKTRW